MGLLGQRKTDWRILFTPSMGKTRFYSDDQQSARYGNEMDKRTALNYLEEFDDAVCIEKIRGFRKGRKIYKKRWSE